MPHQCTHCGEIYPDAAQELLAGCGCGSKFFYYIRQEKLDELNRVNNQEIQDTLTELARADKAQIEKDIREITGMAEEPDKPVILDIESIRVLSPGKFEIDIINLFSKKRPIIYKLEEGKYIIDLTSTYKTSQKEIHKKIRNPVIDKEEIIKLSSLRKTSEKKDSREEREKKDRSRAKKEEKEIKEEIQDKKEEKTEEKKENSEL